MLVKVRVKVKKKKKKEYKHDYLVKQVLKRGSIEQRRSLWYLLWAEAPSQFIDTVPPN